jgi:hypothetical protein
MNSRERAAIRTARDEAARASLIGKDAKTIRAAGGKHQWPLPPGVEGRAVFSADGDHRYVLRREWDTEGGVAVFIGLNPSTAEADVDDPTVRKCWTWASEWDFGSMAMLNLYAYRATDPKELRAKRDLLGDNDAYIRAVASESGMVIAAWGNSRYAKSREAEVVALLLEIRKTLWCLGTCKDGSPRHPLYLPNDTSPQIWKRRTE